MDYLPILRYSLFSVVTLVTSILLARPHFLQRRPQMFSWISDSSKHAAGGGGEGIHIRPQLRLYDVLSCGLASCLLVQLFRTTCCLRSGWTSPGAFFLGVSLHDLLRRTAWSYSALERECLVLSINYNLTCFLLGPRMKNYFIAKCAFCIA